MTVLFHAGVVALLLPLLLACGTPTPPAASQEQTSTTTVAQQAETAAPAATTTPTSAPTVAPTPTTFAFAPRSEVAGVEIGNLTVKEATERVTKELEDYDRPIVLQTEGFSTTLQAKDYVKLPDVQRLIERAQATVDGSDPVKLPLQVSVEQPALTKFVEELAPKIEQTAATTVISDAKALTQTFTFQSGPGRRLDVERSVSEIANALRSGDAGKVELVVESGPAQRPAMAELERVLRDHAAFWKGVAGFYVKDLNTGETIAYNADTVFSGASVMKVPIMIFAYSRLGSLNEQQKVWMRKMIIDSENLEANDLLAASVGSQGTEAALQGVNEMSTMLKDLGLQHTYQLIPYESGEWLIQQSLLPGGGPKQEGQPPFTAPDPYVRTTPREIGELFAMLDECAMKSTGPLIEKVGGKLDQKICKEMVDWLQQPHDQERMVAGLPPGIKVAHKGGWIDDMQSDVGIIDSPGGRFVAAIYIWTNGYVTDEHAHPSPYLGDFAHTIYTFFNPVPPAQPQASAEVR